MPKIELTQIEKITPENTDSFIGEKSIKIPQLEKTVQEKLDTVTKYSEFPKIKANPQDSAEVILYVKMPGGEMVPHACPITYLAEYIKDAIKETILIGE